HRGKTYCPQEYFVGYLTLPLSGYQGDGPLVVGPVGHRRPDGNIGEPSPRPGRPLHRRENGSGDADHNSQETPFVSSITVLLTPNWDIESHRSSPDRPADDPASGATKPAALEPWCSCPQQHCRTHQ